MARRIVSLRTSTLSTSIREKMRSQFILFMGIATIGAAFVLQPGGAGAHEKDAETSGKPVDQRTAELSAARLIADQHGWGIKEILEHTKVQQRFGNLLVRLSEKYPESYAGGIFAERPGATSIVRFVGKVPQEAVEEAERTGIRVAFEGDAKYSEAALQERSRKVHDYFLSLGY